MQIKVTIDKKGNSEILAMNALEDLEHDFQYFLREAKTYSATKPETMFQHKRFLRAALLILFAYVEGVTNRWLFATLEQRHESGRFEELQFKPLDTKVALLTKLASAVTKPNLKTAKSVRNLLVHFKPGRDGEAFDAVTLHLVEDAGTVIESWMTEIESVLGLRRYPDTNEVMTALAAAGKTTKEVSSRPDR